MSSRASATLAIAAFSLFVPSARAQTRPEHFGGAEGTMTIPAAFFAGLPAPGTNGFSFYGYPGFPGGGVGGQTPPLELPNGAEITQLCFVAFDDSWHAAASMTLVAWEYPRIGTTTPTPTQTLATTTTGYGEMPGMSTFCAPLAAPIRVKSFGDLNGDGVPGWTGYALGGSMFYGPMGGAQEMFGSVSIGAAIVVWRRAVSPAPAVARFTDVPTTHPQFRFVEALVASGIASGCTADRFCPDTALTRGNMAQFLATALGLHFPN
jgi:hypothetical protein